MVMGGLELVVQCLLDGLFPTGLEAVQELAQPGGSVRIGSSHVLHLERAIGQRDALQLRSQSVESRRFSRGVKVSQSLIQTTQPGVLDLIGTNGSQRLGNQLRISQ